MSENLSHLRQSSWHFCGLIMNVLISQFDFREATVPSTASILIPGTSNPSERCYNKQKKRSMRWYKTLQAFNTLDTSNCHPTGGLPDILNPAAIPAGLPAAEWWYHHCHQNSMKWSSMKQIGAGGRAGRFCLGVIFPWPISPSSLGWSPLETHLSCLDRKGESY